MPWRSLNRRRSKAVGGGRLAAVATYGGYAPGTRSNSSGQQRPSESPR